MKNWMDRTSGAAALLLLGMSLQAADFQNGQAARAVIGQSSFSAREANLTPTVLAISNGWLYAADASHRVFTYDLTEIAGPKDELSADPSSTCALCGFAPVSSVVQSVFPSVASVSSFGKTVVIADASTHRVLIWRDSASPHAVKAPDVVLGRSSNNNSPISGATLADPISVAFDGKRLFVGDAALHRVLVWNSLPGTDNQPADVVLGQQNLTSSGLSDVPGADTIARPAALASDGTNLYVGDSLNHRILVFTAGDTPLVSNAVVNSGSLMPGALAPGTLVTINGRGLSDRSESVPEDSDQPLPISLAGVQVFLNGVPLPILSVSPTQVRVQFLYGLGNTSAASLYVRSEHTDGTVTTTTAAAVQLLAATPGLFAFGGTEPRNGMVLHTDPLSGEAGAPVTSDSPAKPGEVLVFWATGLGNIEMGEDTPELMAGVPYSGPNAPVILPVEAIVGGEFAPVVSATLPRGAIGVYEVRVQLPVDLTSEETAPLTISQDGQASNTVLVPIEKIVQ